MRSRLTVIALIGATAGLASCKGGEGGAKADAAAPEARAEAPAAPDAAIEASSVAVVAPPVVVADAAVSGSPAFAVLYPGGRLDTTGEDERAADNGLAFTTEASPEEVVEFYRRKAETAGLVSVMSMNQGDVRGYGASDASGVTSLRVLAHPDDSGRTAVKLSWSGG